MERPDPVERLTERGGRPVNRRWRLLVGLVVFVAGGAILRNALGLEWSTEGVRSLVAEAGFWAPLIFIALLVFRLVLVIPSILLLPAGGLLFGTVEGAIYGTVGLTLSGLLNFGLVRYAGPAAFQARISSRFEGLLELARSRFGAIAVAVISGYPFGPITISHLGAAVAGMSLMSFLVAILAGSIVRATTFSLFGASLVESDQLGWASFALAGALVIPMLIPRSREWLRRSFGMKSSDVGASGSPEAEERDSPE